MADPASVDGDRTIMPPALDDARALFARLHTIGFDGLGMTRASYGDGENQAHALLADMARARRLLVRRDWASNLFITLPGRDRTLPAVMTGSHLDTVPCGGNYDGAAGVLAGFACLCGWADAGYVPARDVVLIITRAEESVWFPVSYIGSKSAFGLLEESALAAVRRDDGGTLADHMRASGGQPDHIHTAPVLQPSDLACFVELHIEQGPVLPAADVPVGIVTGICGSVRYRAATIHGRYAHSGATPRPFRADAVMAAATLMTVMQAEWRKVETEGGEMTLTFGVCHTDAAQANFSAVAGRVDLSIDIRSRDPGLLGRMEAALMAHARTVEDEYGVVVDLGARTQSAPAAMDAPLQAEAVALARRAGIPAVTLPSGAGHDAAIFAGQGVPTVMLFVRNANGSHNPYEAMEFDDFALATRLLERLLYLRAEQG
ncbi:hydantoinase/carbamoylase family amidase [Gluconacetobacter asukensis]|uniref:Hydantoinase/carbamoylase family amidase n=2 Tax=Gluconacetobacter asukensis TaxID=1017181 RepID=A0A7W4J350_9PROT|nr:hydantoinase/carbamoylase family amidase [Gluconacetobacter asukensis]